MRRQWKIIAACSIVGLAAIAFAVTRSTPDPEYHGHSLSYWLRMWAREVDRTSPDVETQWAQHKEAAEAVRQIGLDAIPLLVQWTKYEPPPVIAFVAKKWSWKPCEYILQRDHARKIQAFSFFSMEGNEVAVAIPMLSNVVMSASPNSKAADFAIDDLLMIGPQGITTLMSLMRNPNLHADVRLRCIAILGDQYQHGGGGVQRTALANTLLQCANDPDPAFRTRAKAEIQRWAPLALTNNAASN